MITKMTIFLLAALAPALVQAQDLPGCALTGSSTVMIGGKPALRLSDVVNCPPELYEIVPSIFIEGQPIVHFRSGAAAKGDCTAKGESSVMLEGEAAQRTGDVACKSK